MNLSKSMIKVWKCIDKLSGQNGVIILAVKKIIKLTDLSESTVREATRRLAEYGLIKKHYRDVPDYRTGKLKQTSNQYEILHRFTTEKIGGGGGSDFGGQKNKSFKAIKEIKKIKREEGLPAPVLPSSTVSSENHLRPTTRLPAPTTAAQVITALGEFIDNIHPAVVQHVIKLYAKLLPSGHIGSPLAWLKGALLKEQARYNQFGFAGLKNREKAMTFTNFLKAGGHEEAQQAETFWANLIDDRQVIASQWT